MKNKQLFLAISILGVGFGKMAVAQETLDDRWYIAPTASYIWTDEDRQTSRDEYGLGIGLGRAVSQNFNLELKAFFNKYEHQQSNTAKTQYQWDTVGSTLDLQYYLNRNRLSPYAVIGAGIMDSRVHNKNVVGMIGEAGVGVAYKLNHGLSLRSDVRYRYNNNFNNHLTDNNADRYNDMIVNIGIVIPFGKDPTTKANPVPVAKPQALSDDLDNDGVRNAIDKCPNTKLGARVNKVGCNYSVTLKGINFEANSAILTLNAKVLLDNVAKEIINYPSKREIEVQGHASSDGNAEANMVLSQKRAEAVAEYLASKGVENDLTAKGYGSSKQVADETSFEGRLKNRRVELVWN